MDGDDALYRRFLDGDVAALDALIVGQREGLRLYLTAILGDEQDVEDVMVETFARIMVKKPDIREGRFKAYLFRSARNHALRQVSLLKRRRLFRSEQLPVVDRRTPDALLDEAERRRALRLCLDRMEPPVREALWLVFFEEMSYDQAASVLGVTAKKVDNLLMKGKRLMRLELEREGITDANG